MSFINEKQRPKIFWLSVVVILLMAGLKVNEYFNSKQEIILSVPASIDVDDKFKAAFSYWRNSCRYFNSSPDAFYNFNYRVSSRSIYSFLDDQNWLENVYIFTVSVKENDRKVPYGMSDAVGHTCDFLTNPDSRVVLTYKKACTSVCDSLTTEDFYKL